MPRPRVAERDKVDAVDAERLSERWISFFALGVVLARPRWRARTRRDWARLGGGARLGVAVGGGGIDVVDAVLEQET
jgi:hypothetical protein